MVLKWTPIEVDTFAPFLTGFLELIAIVGIYSQLTILWLMSSSMLCFLASVSYWHMYRASRRHPFSQSIIGKLEEGNINWIKVNPLSLIASGVILLFEGIAVGFWPSELARTIVSIITFLLLLAYLAKGCFYFRRAKEILKFCSGLHFTSSKAA